MAGVVHRLRDPRRTRQDDGDHRLRRSWPRDRARRVSVRNAHHGRQSRSDSVDERDLPRTGHGRSGRHPARAHRWRRCSRLAVARRRLRSGCGAADAGQPPLARRQALEAARRRDLGYQRGARCGDRGSSTHRSVERATHRRRVARRLQLRTSARHKPAVESSQHGGDSSPIRGKSREPVRAHGSLLRKPAALRGRRRSAQRRRPSEGVLMPDYEPIDLTSLCNRPLSVVGSSEIRPGLQEFRGLPFEIARDTERCLIELDSDATVISLHNRVVYTVLFLHRLMSSDLLDGGPIGRPVAHYRFEFADGSQASRDIRERFEIALPRSWIRDHPALALPSLGHQLPSRFSGELSRAGRRPTGVVDNPSSFYIWAWRNPKPAIPLKAVVIEPTGVPFVIGAVTIGHVDESPLVPAAAQPVRIDLLDDSADRLFDIEVEVDRGLSSFAYPLPRESAGDFLSSAWAGFGEPSILGSTPSEGMGPYVRLQPNSPAYARIAAVPSAT